MVANVIPLFLRVVKRWLSAAVILYLLFLIFAPMLANKLTYPAPPPSYTTLPHGVTISASDGTQIAAIWLPPSQASQASALTLLFCHGNGEDLGHNVEFIQHLHTLGFGVLAWDYRGYGQTGGSPSEALLFSDSLAVYDFLTTQQKIAPQTIVPLGRSLGSGVAAYIAEQRTVGGLILESAFTSSFKVLLPYLWFPNDQFVTRKRLPHIHVPVLIIHGTDDTLIRLKHGKQLYDLANEPKQALWVAEAGHNDLFYVAGDSYSAALVKFRTLIESSAR